MINIDSNDFALLVKNVNPGSRPIQGLGDREIFYNDIEQLPGGPMPHDNKTYMKCRRAGQKNLSKPVTQAPLGTEASKKKKGTVDHIHDWASNQIATNGVVSFFEGILTIGALALAIWAAWTYSNQLSFLFKLNTVSQSFAAYIRSFIWKVSNVPLHDERTGKTTTIAEMTTV
jgi:hypothetical protein